MLGIGDGKGRGYLPEHMGANLPEVDLSLPVKSLSVGSGSSHSCAIFINNQIKCWGQGYLGQLGYEDGASRGGSLREMGEYLPFVNLH